MKNHSNANEKSPDADPKRVPIDPAVARKWKIRRMPKDLKKELDAMLHAGTLHTSLQLSKWLGNNGFEISRQCIDEYRHKFERRLDAIKMATEQARIVCEQFKDDDEQMQSALMKIVQTRMFEVLIASNEPATESENGDGAATIAPVNITALARSVSGLARAETEHRKWVDRARAGVAAAGKKVDEARAKGLSKNAAEQIKAVLLEI